MNEVALEVDMDLEGEDEEHEFVPFCFNCHRGEIELRNISALIANERRRRKFCIFKERAAGNTVLLCLQCREYFLLDVPSEAGGKILWPAFMWNFLVENYARIGVDIWQYFPLSWRVWWIDRARVLPGMASISVDFPVPHFTDVTERLDNINSCLQGQRWTDIKSISTPEGILIPWVRCPWGCSEFIHKVKDVPFDVVLEHFAFRDGRTLKIYSPPTKRCCTTGMRDDALTFVGPILLNPAWVIRPCIFMDIKDGPRVCCCRFHDEHSVLSMLHVPRNPTLNVMTPYSNQLARVVPVPRSIHHVKAKQYSNCYQMCMITGTYAGLDTVYLREMGRYDLCDQLSSQRDSLSIAGRKDMLAHVSALSLTSPMIPKWFSQNLVEFSDKAYSNIEYTKPTYCEGATFMTVEDSSKLHYLVNWDTRDVVQSWIPNDGAVGDDEWRTVSLHFVGAWPKQLAFIHPNNSHGIQFGRLPKVMSTMYDTRMVWVMLSLIACVPCVYGHVTRHVRNDTSWEGWILTYVIQKCFPNRSQGSSRNNPFKKMTLGKLCSCICDSVCVCGQFSSCYDVGRLPIFFPAEVYNGACIYFTSLQIIPQEAASYDCVVVHNGEYVELLDAVLESDLFELRLVVCTEPLSSRQQKKRQRTREEGEHLPSTKWEGCVYARHGGAVFPSWWKCERDGNFIQQNEMDLPVLIAAKKTWNILVYIAKKKKRAQQIINDRYLESMADGQSKVYCGDHRAPLIVTPFVRGGKGGCSFRFDSGQVCPKVSIYTCAVRSCKEGICRHHFNNLVCSENVKFYVGRDGCDYNTRCRPYEPVAQDEPELDMDMSSPAGLPLVDLDENFIVYNANPDDADCDSCESFYYEDEAEEELDLDDEVCDIPATNAGRPVTNVQLTDSAVTAGIVGCHIVFNQLGKCLRRRNSDIAGSTKEKNILQRLVATSPGNSNPLLYWEGMIFPDIFYADKKDGSIIGALPSALLEDDDHLKKHGIASLKDHFRTRLTNPSLLTSLDHRYIFTVFDALANLGMRGEDSRVVLSRGFAASQVSQGITMRDQPQNIFDTITIDDKPVVNQLAAAIKEAMPTYFYTYTANQKDSFGMKYLKEWLDSAQLLAILVGDQDLTASETNRLLLNLVDSSGVMMLRCWMENSMIWLRYITQSPEEPVGRVTDSWARAELQDLKANLPHFHVLLWTDDRVDTSEGLRKTLGRIRGAVKDIVTYDEMEVLLENKYFARASEIEDALEIGRKVLPHKCSSRCQVPVKGAVGPDAAWRCKMGTNRSAAERADHSFIELHVKHRKDANEVFLKLGLLEIDYVLPSGQAEYKIVHEALQNKKHCPPTHGGEGIISPVFGNLFLMNPSSQNAQFCTGYTLSRYLAKYIGSIDQCNFVPITGAGNQNPTTFSADFEQLHNSKITGASKADLKKIAAGRKAKAKRGRALSVTEATMLILGYEQVYTSLKFKYINTSPMGERGGYLRKKPVDRLKNAAVAKGGHRAPQDLDIAGIVASVRVRNQKQFPLWRRFTADQVLIIQDQMYSNVTRDTVTSFSIRPPELRFVMHLALYGKWFKQVGVSGNFESRCIEFQDLLCTDYKSCAWIDGADNLVLVRPGALAFIVDYVQQAPAIDFLGERNKKDVEAHFARMSAIYTSVSQGLPAEETRDSLDGMRGVFLTVEDEKLPIMWFRSVRPAQGDRFLIHLLLKMGAFTTEYELFGCSSIREAFIKARLFNESDPQGSALALTRRYILEELVHIPGGTPSLDNHVVKAYEVIQSMFIDNELVSYSLPPVLFTRLQRETDNQITQYLTDDRSHIACTLLTQLQDAGLDKRTLPLSEDVIAATYTDRFDWDLTTDIGRSPNQSLESHNEHGAIRLLCKKQIAKYQDISGGNGKLCTKSVSIVGGAGAGKTVIMRLVGLYAMCQGLNIAISCVLSERASELGGRHLHALFHIPVNNKLSPSQAADVAIARLARDPQGLELIRRLDVLLLDEFGQVPAALLALLDILLRRVRRCPRFMGGVLLITTMDILQLLPINGVPPMMSPHMLTSFVFGKLDTSVRAAQDVLLQRIQKITRMSPSDITDEIGKEFKTLIAENCHFIKSIHDPSIPDNAVFVYGRRAPMLEAQHVALEKLRRIHRLNIRSRVAEDQEKATAGNGEKQSQLALLFELPDEAALADFLPITLLIAPSGCKALPDPRLSKEDLIAHHRWTEQSIGPPYPLKEEVIGPGLKGRRKQYGLRPRIASTIHGAMGQTLDILVTEIRESGICDLWEAAQVVVLLSRTRHCSDMYFIGLDSEALGKTLLKVLTKQSQFAPYMHYLMNKLCSAGISVEDVVVMPVVVNLANHPYRPIDVPLPPGGSGVCYLLVSTVDTNVTYIGETIKPVGVRLEQHNSGIGASQTANQSLRPWALLAYVCGFDGSREKRKSFEKDWQDARGRIKRGVGSHYTANETITAAMVVMDNGLYTNTDLRLVQCGKLD